MCGSEVARDLVARRGGRGLAGEERLGDDADRALRARHRLLHGLHTRGGRRVAVHDARQSHRGEKGRVGWRTHIPAALAMPLRVFWRPARSPTMLRRSMLHWRLPIWRAAMGSAGAGETNRRSGSGWRGWGGAPGEVRTGVDLGAGEEDEEGEESGDDVGKHGGWWA